MPDKKISDNKTQKNVQKKFLWIWVSLDILKLKCVFKVTVKETWKGGLLGWNLKISGVYWDP